MAIKKYTEEFLRTWFRENTDKEFCDCEERFIAVAKDTFPALESNGRSSHLQRNDWLFDQVPRAELTIGSTNIRVEELLLDLVRVLLCSGTAELLLGEETSVLTIGMNLLYFAKDANQYFSRLSPPEREFYRYLVLNYYPYSKRLNDMFFRASSGFSLDDALKQYALSCLKKGNDSSYDDLLCAAKRAACSLEEKEILQKGKDGNWRISF